MLTAIVGIGQLLSLVAVAYGALLVAMSRPGFRNALRDAVRDVAQTAEIFGKSLELAHVAERNKRQAVHLGRATWAASARNLAEQGDGHHDKVVPATTPAAATY